MADRSLSDTHAALHEHLDAALLRVLVALVDRDPRAARAALERFRAELTAHALVEEERVLPLLAERGQSGARNPQHIEPEHRLLERTAAALGDALAPLPDALTSQAIVEVLPLAYRLRGIYEHHSERERLLYPLLDAHPEAPALAAALRKAGPDGGA